MIDFNRAPYLGTEVEYMQQAIANAKLCGDGPFTKKCSQLMKEQFGTKHVLLTTSCTHALEMAAFLCDLKPGDEVIMPSYTFVSTADAFVLQGAKIVFVDVHPETMNIDETKIEAAITERTKVIVPVHYAGVACEMDTIMAIAKKYNLKVVEDAAQGVNAWYKGRALGTIGDFGCYSFHETKNYTMGEGGALLFQDDAYLERAYLYAQLLEMDKINDKRRQIFDYYYEHLAVLEEKGYLARPYVPDYAVHNGHMFYVRVKDLETRTDLIRYMKEKGVLCVFHYIPLHSAPAGKQYGTFHGEDVYTTKESECLMRLPMYYSLSMDDVKYVTDCLLEYYGE